MIQVEIRQNKDGKYVKYVTIRKNCVMLYEQKETTFTQWIRTQVEHLRIGTLY
jgi:hypothetical protein